MSSEPRVTVLMTVYNGLPYLREALESVLAQTFTAFELLIVDDASTDGSVAYLKGVRDPRIRLVRNARNHSQVWSLNRGLALARGSYVARLDQDDVCLPDRLRRQMDVLDRRPKISVVGTLMREIDAQGRVRGVLGRTIENYGAFVGSLVLGLCPVCHPSVMYRRDVVLEAGGYEASYAPAEDVKLWQTLALRRHQAAVIPEPLMLLRKHALQQSVQKDAIQQRNIWRVQEEFLQAYAPAASHRGLGLLVRRDPGLWSAYPSKAEVAQELQALRMFIASLEAALQMTAAERAALARVMHRWLGWGVTFGSRMSCWPSALFYPTVWLLSPLLVPRVRPMLSRARGLLNRVRQAEIHIEP